MTSFSDQGREEGTSGTRVNIVSKEAEMLQEIANILLLLKQRKIQGYEEQMDEDIRKSVLCCASSFILKQQS